MSEVKPAPTSTPHNPVPTRDAPPKPKPYATQHDVHREDKQLADLPHAPDADVKRRPGDPKEQQPRPVVGSHWSEPERQNNRGVEILRDPSRKEDSATFGTQHPPKGLSGIMRRAAYELPDYKMSRWLLLIGADRVASVEWTLSPRRPRNWWLALAGTALVAGAYYYKRPRNRFAFWR